MAVTKKSPLFALLLLSLLLGASEMTIRKVDARICESPSKNFNGLCFRSSNCATICHGEHFSDGQCQGVRRRCICRKQC
ncbi:hypothetical protein HHK36_014666 [Tetracentron sinense]|uniref:Knottins-like domain-containing protein n=1 Tax=Tetracentron sinense TaxID=13715 RepID=A0A835DD46_TETSI|nr:hypothetical protein HHK36_014666 [Tetracentron sinense]